MCYEHCKTGECLEPFEMQNFYCPKKSCNKVLPFTVSFSFVDHLTLTL